MNLITQNLTDIVVLVIFLCFAVAMGRRGLYRSLAGVIVTVAAVLGALLLTYLLAAPVTDWAFPWVEARFAARVDLSGVHAASPAALTEQLGQLLPEDFLSLVRKLGMELGAFVSAAVGGSAVVADARQAASDAVGALLYETTASVVKILLFVLLLIVLRLLLRGVKNAIGLAFRLPVIRGVDVLGGAVLGLVVCAVLVYVILWICDLFRVEAVMSLAAQSKILQLFLTPDLTRTP